MIREVKENNDVDLIKKKVLTHFKNKWMIHCKYKNGFYKNGLIKDISADFFILDENFDGELPIFFQELSYVMTYNEKMRAGRDGK